jgi:hypothetical protein
MTDDPLCPMCGADSTRRCELAEDFGGECPWELSRDDDDSASGIDAPKAAKRDSGSTEGESPVGKAETP